MLLVGGIQHQLPIGQNSLGLTEINHGDAGVTMLVVIPMEELLAKSAGYLQYSRNDQGTPADTSEFGTGFPNTGCHRKHKVDYGFW